MLLLIDELELYVCYLTISKHYFIHAYISSNNIKISLFSLFLNLLVAIFMMLYAIGCHAAWILTFAQDESLDLVVKTLMCNSEMEIDEVFSKIQEHQFFADLIFHVITNSGISTTFIPNLLSARLIGLSTDNCAHIHNKVRLTVPKMK